MTEANAILDKYTEKRLVVGSQHLIGRENTEDDIERLCRLDELLPFSNVYGDRDRTIAQGHSGPRMETATYGYHFPVSPGYGEDLSWQSFWRERYEIHDEALAIIAAAADSGYSMVTFDQDVCQLDEEELTLIMDKYLDISRKPAPVSMDFSM